MGLLVGLHRNKENEVEREVAFWHKQPFIHYWFIKHIDYEEYGKNECSKEVLEKLLDSCNKCLETDDVNEWKKYFDYVFYYPENKSEEKFRHYIEWTKEQIEKVLKETDWETETIRYFASY